jgi:hypothetical protein
MADQRDDEQELGWQLHEAMEAFRETAVRLLRTGEVHPQLIVMAAAQAAGEMGAGLAVAGGDDLEKSPGRARGCRAAGRPGSRHSARGGGDAGSGERLIHALTPRACSVTVV